MGTTDKSLIMDALRLASDGSGVGYPQGLATFVPGLLPGETGAVVVEHQKKNYQRARLVQVLQATETRQDPPCGVFSICGGCQLQHMLYEETLLWKNQWVRDALQRIARLDIAVEPTLAMDFPWRYRNKATLHRTPADERGGRSQLGYYKERSHSTVIFQDCLLLSERMNGWIRALEGVLHDYSEIQEVVFRELYPGEGNVLLRTTGNEGSSSADLLRRGGSKLESMLTDALPGVSGAWTLGVSGVPERLWGKENIEVPLLGLNFQVSPLAFFQVNSRMTEKLYALALQMAALKGRESVWDLYSGIGTLTLALARQAGETWGIEENPFAVANARRNAVLNDMTRVEFFQGKVEEQLGNLIQKPDVVVMDPPRAGVEKAVIDRLLHVQPARIVYVSCDPGTLARDLSLLIKGGYKVDLVQPVDMFPWTRHVETLCRLQRA